jgi:DMSO/TMAO reductase YedYZ molybdopterin-dependent catalytic subunit
MAIISRGFTGRRRAPGSPLPPGQYLTKDFPVLSAGPTPRITTDRWQFSLTSEAGAATTWNWAQFQQLPAETFTVDIHCVTRWSKFGTSWRGVSVDTLLAGVDTAAGYIMATCYGGYTTNLPIGEVLDGKAWVVYEYDGKPLPREHGGPARLLVPHLYFWKSAKWVNGLRLMDRDKRGFWEELGYHDLGDPWREQRYWGD